MTKVVGIIWSTLSLSWVALIIWRTQQNRLIFPSPHTLSVCHSCTHTNVVSIMAGWCSYNDLIFPDRKGAISFVCHTKRREAAWVQVDHLPLNTYHYTMVSSHRLPMSTEALINRGQALVFCINWTKVEFCGELLLKMTLQVAAVKLCCKNWHSMKALKWIFDFNTSNLFLVLLSTLLLCFFRSLFVINTPKEMLKKKHCTLIL